MRLLTYGLLSGFLSLGCSSAVALTGTGSGAGGYGGAAGTTGSWTGSGGASGTGGGLQLSSGATSSASGSASGSTAASSGATSSASGAGGGGVSTSGDCMSGSDCPSGQCVAVTPGGFNVCLVALTPATTCTSALDQCCPATSPCPDKEACYLGPLVPVCAGVAMAPHNQCAVDQCAKDADCAANQICALAGTFGLEIRACVAASCKLDTDCTAHAGGMCAPAQDPCCVASDGLFCVYPGNGGCRSDADCPPTSGHPTRYCSPDSAAGIASCQDGGPICPA